MPYDPREFPSGPFHTKGYDMKTSLFILLTSLSFSALAQIPRELPCQEFEQKLNAADAQVKDFDRELRKIDSKLRSVEEQISLRTQGLNTLINQRDGLNNSLRTLGSEQSSLRVEISRLQSDSVRLRSEISQKENQRQYHVAQAAAASNLEVKRQHLRSSKQLEKEIESLAPQLSSMDQTISASAQRISRIDLQTQQQSQMIADINRQIEQQQRDPSLIRLQQERSQAIEALSNAQSTLDNLNDKVARASSHVEMCHGYLELSVKYPAALRISKKLTKQGCAKYRAVDQGNELENLAQDELLASACR